MFVFYLCLPHIYIHIYIVTYVCITDYASVSQSMLYVCIYIANSHSDLQWQRHLLCMCVWGGGGKRVHSPLPRFEVYTYIHAPTFFFDNLELVAVLH